MSLIERFQTVYELVKAGLTIDQREEVLKFREEVLQTQEENQNLRQEVAELKKALEIKEKLSHDGSVYWLGEGEKREGPFCQRCKDVDEKLVHLQRTRELLWFCLECKSTYVPPGYEPPEIDNDLLDSRGF
ncbi:MAG: hypothetical protein JRI80_19695 [Deltaproteobacteria bacterium]|nr:hypothetical protein [Deltaproteobacteria bacterium]